ncbi:hypothetical protein [Sorangium sp. So ce406]|uniref:hypothetical protein n=1 Tax=Sorangium sp. So ce406 TaxID=3133311 RepID=UPI003F5CA9B7
MSTFDSSPLGGGRLSTDRGEIRLEQPSPGVLVVRCSGHGEAAFVSPLLDHFEALAASGHPADLFVDAEHLTDFDREYRAAMVTWITRNRPRLHCVNVLVRSRLASMGVSLARLRQRGLLVPFVSRQDFEATLRAVVEQKSQVVRADPTISFEAPIAQRKPERTRGRPANGDE